MSRRGLSLRIVGSVLGMLGAFPAAAGTLVRVTDPSNPVVTDAAESGGAFWVDLDDDDDLDLFVANGNLASQDNALYLNVGDGFVKVGSGAVVTDGGSSIGGAFGDFDEDGLPDLFVVNRNNFGNFLYRGAGDTAFVKVAEGAPVEDVGNSNSASWVDADVDGDLDLYVVNFGGGDFFYRNDGAPDHPLVPLASALPQIGNGPTIPGAWSDFDGDRDADLFVGFAGSANDVLYRNDGGFQFVATTLADGRSTLGASWGDFDGDGDPDLFAANYLGHTSILYRNDGAPGFALTPLAASAVSIVPGNAVGSAWGDIDNDGDLDLFVARDGEDNLLFTNDGPPDWTFTQVLVGDAVNDAGQSFGCVFGDYDVDGALDLFVANRLNEPNFLYHNAGDDGAWMTLRLRGTASNRSAVGARAFATATMAGGSRRQMREVVSQTGYNSGNSDLHFGLGDAAIVDTLRIEWPSGTTDVHLAVPLNRLHRITEGAVATGAATPGPAQGRRAVRLAQRGWGRAAAVRLTLDRPAAGRLVLRDVAGSVVAELFRGHRTAGEHTFPLSASAVRVSGVYFCTAEFDGERAAARVVLVR